MPPKENTQEDVIKQLQQQLEALTLAFYQDNYPSSQDFNKNCRFNNRLRIPHYTSLPASAVQGEIIEVGGRLYIASAPNTWELVGSQT